jgi:hypothetical protein
MSDLMPYAAEVNTFLNDSFKKYRSIMANFVPVASGTASDTTKIRKAAVHLTQLADVIAGDFIKANSSVTMNDSLFYVVILRLLDEARVREATGLTGKAWIELGALPQFEEMENFIEYASNIRDQDSLRDELSSLCC